MGEGVHILMRLKGYGPYKYGLGGMKMEIPSDPGQTQ
jgi:hypothetical protein